MWNQLELSDEVRPLCQSLVLSPTRARFLLLLLPYYWATCSFSALLYFATAIYSVQVRCHNWQVISWNFFVKVMCWIIWKTWAEISKISWKHCVTKNSEWLCLILLSFRVSDFYIFCECLFVIGNFRLNFRKSNVLNLNKFEQKSQKFRESIVFEKQIPICECACRVSDCYIFCEFFVCNLQFPVSWK